MFLEVIKLARRANLYEKISSDSTTFKAGKRESSVIWLERLAFTELAEDIYGNCVRE